MNMINLVGKFSCHVCQYSSWEVDDYNVTRCRKCKAIIPVCSLCGNDAEVSGDLLWCHTCCGMIRKDCGEQWSRSMPAGIVNEPFGGSERK